MDEFRGNVSCGVDEDGAVLATITLCNGDGPYTLVTCDDGSQGGGYTAVGCNNHLPGQNFVVEFLGQIIAPGVICIQGAVVPSVCP